MGSKGRQPINKFVVGSSSLRVLADSRSRLGSQLRRLAGFWLVLLACAGFSRAAAQSREPAGEPRSRGDAALEAARLLLLAGAMPSNPNPGGGGSSADLAHPTYLRDVLPIIMRRCSRCHNVQARFVYNWLDYQTASADRFEIARRVWDSWKGSYFKESMPIENSPEALSITSEERAQLRNWALQGAPRGTPPPPRLNQTPAEKLDMGRQLFSSICAACHQPTGRGIPNVFPPLASSDFLNADKNRAVKTVLNGRQGEIVVNGQRFNNSMPKFPLSDQDVADVLTYVYSSFGNSGVEVSSDEVARLRAEPPDIEQPLPPGARPTPQPKSEFE